MKIGKLITLEGGENSGKTTQADRLFNNLQLLDIPVIKTREPGGTAAGQHIRNLLLNAPLDIDPIAELLLYQADRAQHVAEIIKPYLEQGYIVLCDRYIDSTLAYQGYGRKLPHGIIYQTNAIATGGVIPDYTLWLDVDPKLSVARGGKRDRIENEAIEFHQRVNEGFRAIYASERRVTRIDGTEHVDAVEKAIWAAVSHWVEDWQNEI